MIHISTITQRIILFATAVLLLTACSVAAELEPTPILPPPPTAAGAAATGTAPAADPAAETPAAAETAVTGTPDETGLPTPLPTPTLAPTPAPETSPSLTMAAANDLPATTRDLVFISDGALRMWNHNNAQLETLVPRGETADPDAVRETVFTPLAGDVTQFDVSRDGNRIAAARLTYTETITDTSDGSPVQRIYTESELLFIDTVSKETWTLVPTLTNFVDLSISPNQQQVAFIGSTLSGFPEPTATAADAPRRIYLTTTPDGQPREIGACADFCGGLLWHPNNELVLWADGDALWMYNVSGNTPEQLVQNTLGSAADTSLFRPVSWAGNGRFLLVAEQLWEGSRMAVLDVPSGQILAVPDTGYYADPFPPEVSWMQDDRLLVLRADIAGQRHTSLELWRVQPDAGQLVREEFYDLDANAAGAGAVHFENGRFGYGLLAQSDVMVSGLYVQTSLSEPPERVNGLAPAFVAPNIVWSPDGSGAVVVQNQLALYAPSSGDDLYQMTAVFGPWAHHFAWLPAGTVPR